MAQNQTPKKRGRPKGRKDAPNLNSPRRGRPSKEEMRHKRIERAAQLLKLEEKALQLDDTELDLPTRKEFINLIFRYNGNLNRIAEQIGLTRYVVQRTIENDDEYLLAYLDAKEARIDKAEHTVDAAIEFGDAQTARWLLDRLGANRGYVTKQEIDHNIEITVNAPQQFLPPQTEQIGFADYTETDSDQEDRDV